MPHLRLQIPEEWLGDDFKAATSFDARKLLDHLVRVIAGLRMPNPAASPSAGPAWSNEPPTVPFVNIKNLKHAIEPLYYAHVAGDPAKRFIHVTLAAGNDTAGRTAAVRKQVSEVLGAEVDKFVGELPQLESVTVWVQEIDRDRGYSTTAERKKKRSHT